jgi:hypothetical protein
MNSGSRSSVGLIKRATAVTSKLAADGKNRRPLDHLLAPPRVSTAAENRTPDRSLCLHSVRPEPQKLLTKLVLSKNPSTPSRTSPPSGGGGTYRKFSTGGEQLTTRSTRSSQRRLRPPLVNAFEQLPAGARTSEYHRHQGSLGPKAPPTKSAKTRVRRGGSTTQITISNRKCKWWRKRKLTLRTVRYEGPSRK